MTMTINVGASTTTGDFCRFRLTGIVYLRSNDWTPEVWSW